ncbi:MAG: TM0106 family RecB-like putative nuclease [Candidatus Helarchaeota archaeon]
MSNPNKNRDNREIFISATDVFEYIKCPAFFKQYIKSGKSLRECYPKYYNEEVFSLGVKFEAEKIKELSLVVSTKSLKELIKDYKTKILRIEPPLILKRELPHQDIFKENNLTVFATGRPDLLIRDIKTNKIVPLEYKTSLRNLQSSLFQLRHYCFLLQEFDETIPNLGFIKIKDHPKIRFKLESLTKKWESVIQHIVMVKFGINDLKDKDFRWNRECQHCYFYFNCNKIIKLKPKINQLPGVGERRYEMIEALGIKNIDELAKIKPEKLWNGIMKIPDGKIIFQREINIRRIIGVAKALIKGEPVPLYPKLKLINLTSKDALFDTEYNTQTTPPTIFSICVGFFNNDKTLSLENWFAENPTDVNAIVTNFYRRLREKQIKRVIGWNIKSADIPQLKKIAPFPNIEILDLYRHIYDQIALPLLSYRLKEISEYLFGKEKIHVSNIYGGLQAVNYYKKYLQTRDSNYKESIILYNKQDVISLFEIIKWFENLSQNLKNKSLE